MASDVVVSASYNTKKLTALLLWSLHRVLNPPVASIVIVDNASTDGSAELLAQWQDAGLCTLIVSKTNLGHGAALNLALTNAAVADAGRVWVLDSDCVIARADALCAAREAYPTAQLIGEAHWDPWHRRRRLEAYSLVMDPIALSQPEIAPFADGGDPAFELIVSAERAGLEVADFPFTAERYIIHRGRGSLAAVAEAGDDSHPLFEWALEHNSPHYGGIEGAIEDYQRLVEAFEAEVGPSIDLVRCLGT